MVRKLVHRLSMQKSRSFHFKKMFEMAGRTSSNHHTITDRESDGIENIIPYSPAGDDRSPQIGSPSEVEKDCGSSVEGKIANIADRQPSDVEQMKEKFAKLLLGEDMSGGGKGVSSALALSNAITNLAASIFGEQSKLQPMPADRKARWRKEIEWLLSVTDRIVEFVPSKQMSQDGSYTEVMVTKQRIDLHMNIPALRKLDAMLIDTLDKFGDENEFWYASKDSEDSEESRTDDKWWLPTVKVPPNGLSDPSLRWLNHQKESVNQVLKAAMAINAQVLSEMEIPENYIESLPKNGRVSLGDMIYKSITEEYFDSEQFLSTIDLSTEHKVLDLKNRIEASIIIWKRKMNHKEGKPSWGSAVSLEKREIFEERAETILLLLKQQFPGIPQSSLDISKIQYNKDVGQAVLESYSRVIESLAFTVMSRIEDVLYADGRAQEKATELESSAKTETDSESAKSSDAGEDSVPPSETPNSKTLLDFMGWDATANESKRHNFTPDQECYCKGQNDKPAKPAATPTKRFLYLDKLESGFRTVTDRL